MKKQVFHDAAAGVLIGLILSILFSLIYAPNTYAPLNPYSLIGQVMDQHQVHGALVLLYWHTYLGSHRYALQLWQPLIQP